MKNNNNDTRRQTDEEKIMETIRKLPPEYVRKVLIYAGTLQSIFAAKQG